MARGPQRRGAQCSCIGLRPALGALIAFGCRWRKQMAWFRDSVDLLLTALESKGKAGPASLFITSAVQDHARPQLKVTRSDSPMRLLSGVCRKFSWGCFHSVAYGGHLYLVCAVCDVNIWRHIHVSKQGEICWHNLHILVRALPSFFVSLHWI